MIHLAYFRKYPNFGDSLSPWLVTRIAGVRICAYDPVTLHPCRHLIAMGSILQWATKDSVIWGSGLISQGTFPKECPARICAVRGPLTRKRLTDRGLDTPPVYGDPALLLPELYDPAVTPIHDVGLVPHYADKDAEFVRHCRLQGVTVIDVFSEIESFVIQVKQCRKILSSSLHGLICADSYGIPTKWIQVSDKVIGHGFKFKDYYASIGQPEEQAAPVRDWKSLSTIAAMCSVKEIGLNLEALRTSFPSQQFVR